MAQARAGQGFRGAAGPSAPAGPTDLRNLISPSSYTYERLSDVGSPEETPYRRNFPNTGFGDAAGSDSDDADGFYPNRGRQAPMTWLDRLKNLGQRAPPPVQSNYLTLIPLNDERLKPRHTALLVSCLLLLAVALAAGVFVVVPRGVTVGSIQVRSSRMSFNTSKSTYQIILTATIPIFNPNYLPVRVAGSLLVSFYDQQAGLTALEPQQIPARALPEVIEVDMDASSVPQKYLFTIYTQCFTFPERIIFFLTGRLQSRFLGYNFSIPDIDSYFIVPCTNSPDHDAPDPPKPARPLKPPHMPLPPPKPPRPPYPPLWEAAHGEGAEAGVSEAGVEEAAWRERQQQLQQQVGARQQQQQQQVGLGGSGSSEVEKPEAPQEEADGGRRGHYEDWEELGQAAA
ncbi:hypothetical protein CHLRE_07g314300v5 [Chlamydomonas reinhardtii]|uniref:Uncharacterized protein n=1 Tax=Chlamydomonas reinhardtii TaxID=3055 RepID=A0A2K3DIL2_CHLRE|nr:uncharacterized protein CHLRE_07g314300v5 [Chlamydomonas reinhardtii]PNW80361.1 hypothetical protein CHLRE_07g314300v5 [Chlamydomonas reinhardtii]